MPALTELGTSARSSVSTSVARREMRPSVCETAASVSDTDPETRGESREGRLSRHEFAALALVGGLALGVRLLGIGSQSLWEDEVASARIIGEPTLVQMLGRVVHTESTPPFWYVGEWLLHQAGMPILDGRLVSALLGGLLTVLVVLLARRFLSFPLALAAGGLVGLGEEFVRHGSELRAYELLATLSVVFALCLLKCLAGPTRWRETALAAAVAAGGLTHFFFEFSAIAAGAWLLIDPAVRSVRRQTVAAIVVGSAIAASWLPLMLIQYHPGRFWWIGPFRLRPVMAVPLRFFTYAYSQPVLGPALSLVAVVLVVCGGIRLARRSAAGRLVFVLALAPVAEAAFVWALGMPIFDRRNLIGVGAFVAVAGLAALEALPPPAGRVGAALLVTLVGVSLAVHGFRWIPPYREMALTLVRDGWNGAHPIAVFGDPHRYLSPLEWYLPGKPRLGLVPFGDTGCSSVFVLRPSGRVVREHGSVLTRRAPTLRGARYLAVTSKLARCRGSVVSADGRDDESRAQVLSRSARF
jgi:hypothetical protein